MTRIATLFLAVLATAAGLFAATPSVAHADEIGSQSSRAATCATEVVPDGQRRVQFCGAVNGGSADFWGKVSPYWNNKITYLQRKGCGTCAWRRVRHDRTNDYGKYRYPNVNRYGYYRVMVPARGAFNTSYSGVLHYHN